MYLNKGCGIGGYIQKPYNGLDNLKAIKGTISSFEQPTNIHIIIPESER